MCNTHKTTILYALYGRILGICGHLDTLWSKQCCHILPVTLTNKYNSVYCKTNTCTNIQLLLGPAIEWSRWKLTTSLYILTSNSMLNSYFKRFWMCQHLPNHLYSIQCKIAVITDNTIPRHSGVFMRSTAMQTGSTNFRDRGHRTTQEDKSFLFNSISYSQNIVKWK